MTDRTEYSCTTGLWKYLHPHSRYQQTDHFSRELQSVLPVRKSALPHQVSVADAYRRLYPHFSHRHHPSILSSYKQDHASRCCIFSHHSHNTSSSSFLFQYAVRQCRFLQRSLFPSPLHPFFLFPAAGKVRIPVHPLMRPYNGTSWHGSPPALVW